MEKLLIIANHIMEYPEDIIARESGQQCMDMLINEWLLQGLEAMRR